MSWGKAGFVGAALVVLASANQGAAQTPSHTVGKCEQARVESRTIAISDRQYPFAGVSTDEVYGLKGSGCRVLSFYRLFDRSPPQTREDRRNRVSPPPGDKTPRFIARLVTGDDLKRPDWLVSTQWADGDACPAMEHVLEKLSGVIALKFAGEGPGDVRMFTVDGIGYDLWAQGPLYPSPQMDYTFDLKMKSNVGTPLANWIVETEKALATCWTSALPEVK